MALWTIDPSLLEALEKVTIGDTRPDLTFILDVPAEIGLKRAAELRRFAGQDADRFELEDGHFHEKLREAFLAIARREPERCVVIDGSREPDAIEGDIWRAVAERLIPMPASLTQMSTANG